MSMCMVLATGLLFAADAASWEAALERAAFTKEGLERLYNPHYQYAIIGLGGTTMRVGPGGFTRPGAPKVIPGGHLQHLPYLAYEYWWDEEAHRHLPFDLAGGYGEDMESGQVTGFREHLDIRTGLLTIDLDLRVDMAWEGLYQIGRNAFHSRREMFVTPEGVLVIRITDAPEAAFPFRMGVYPNQHVRVYLNQGIYAKEHPSWEGSAESRPGGMVITATRPGSCVATLAVAVEADDPAVDAGRMRAGGARPGQTVTLYIAPGSSYAGPDPAETAWTKAERARSLGYEAQRQATADWWRAWHGRSSVSLPEDELMRWYVRSLYYHGVYFGNTRIPPGCNATSIESFAGAICPEYDLAFSQFAMLYTNHLDGARGVADWIAGALPRAEQYAAEGLVAHKVSVKYTGGAKYTSLMGHDGTALLMPTEGEGVNAYSNYPGANAAAMALAYADWSGDREYMETALRVLRGTTCVSLEDQHWRDDFQAYLDRNMPSTVQQSAAIFGLRESLRRGVAEPGWAEMDGKILLPTAQHNGRTVIPVGPGAEPFAGYGDASWLKGLWWYGNLRADDPRVRAAHDMISESFTGKYVFNNAWMGVFAAKLGDGDAALEWARRMIQPAVTLFDDTCFGEIVIDYEDFKKTPEIGAHGGLVCNLTQMLLDPDDDRILTVFPAVPDAWLEEGVSFQNLAARGGVLVSGSLDAREARVVVGNPTGAPVTRALRVRLPRGVVVLEEPVEGGRVEDGWFVTPDMTLQPGQPVAFTLRPASGPSSGG